MTRSSQARRAAVASLGTYCIDTTHDLASNTPSDSTASTNFGGLGPRSEAALRQPKCTSRTLHPCRPDGAARRRCRGRGCGSRAPTSSRVSATLRRPAGPRRRTRRSTSAPRPTSRRRRRQCTAACRPGSAVERRAGCYAAALVPQSGCVCPDVSSPLRVCLSVCVVLCWGGGVFPCVSPVCVGRRPASCYYSHTTTHTHPRARGRRADRVLSALAHTLPTRWCLTPTS